MPSAKHEILQKNQDTNTKDVSTPLAHTKKKESQERDRGMAQRAVKTLT